MFETRGLVGKKEHPDYPNQVSNEYYTTDGVIQGGKFYPKGGGGPEGLAAGDGITVAPGGAFGSFIAAIRSRKPEDNNCDAEVAHYSSALCHLANISYRLGQPGNYDAARGSIGKNELVVEALEKIRDNAAGVGVPTASTTYTVGPSLSFDPGSEKFLGDSSSTANKLLTRPYRAPFVVPEVV